MYRMNCGPDDRQIGEPMVADSDLNHPNVVHGGLILICASRNKGPVSWLGVAGGTWTIMHFSEIMHPAVNRI